MLPYSNLSGTMLFQSCVVVHSIVNDLTVKVYSGY